MACKFWFILFVYLWTEISRPVCCDWTSSITNL